MRCRDSPLRLGGPVGSVAAMHLLTYPDPALAVPAARVPEPLDADDRTLWSELYDVARVMARKWGGYAVAGPQVGSPFRWFVVDTHRDLPHWTAGVYCNPRVMSAGPEAVRMEEGCLSLPGIRMAIVRPSRLRLAWEDERGVGREAEFDGLAARVILHEMDHLSGRLMVDHATAEQTRGIEPALQAMRQGG